MLAFSRTRTSTVLVILLIVAACGFSCHITVHNRTKMNKILVTYQRLNSKIGKLSLSPWTYTKKSSFYEAACDNLGCSGLNVNAKAVPIVIEMCVYELGNDYNRTPVAHNITIGCTCINEAKTK